MHKVKLQILAAAAGGSALIALGHPVLSHGLSVPDTFVMESILLAVLVAPWAVWRWTRSLASQAVHPVAEWRGVGAGVAAMIAVGLGLTLLAMELTRRQAIQVSLAKFEKWSDQIESDVNQRAALFVQSVNGAKGLFVGSWLVRAHEFERFAESIHAHQQSTTPHVLGYIERVPRLCLDEFVEEQRSDAYEEFEVTSAGDHPILYVVKYFEPAPARAGVLGKDVWTMPVWREAIEKAAFTGQPVLSGATPAINGDGRCAEHVYVVPVFDHVGSREHPEDTLDALDGVVFATLRFEAIVRGIPRVADGSVALTISDGSDDDQEPALYRTEDEDESAVGVRGAGARPLFATVRSIQFAGRDLTLHLRTRPGIEAGLVRSFAWCVGLSGTLVTGLFATLLWTIGTSRARAVRLASAMTSDLSRAKFEAERALREVDRLRAAIDLHCSVSVSDASGAILFANSKFCELCGYSKAELLGQSHRMLNSGVHPRSFWTEMWSTVSAGKAWRGDVCNRAKDGSLYWVSSIVVPFLDAAGRVERYVSIRTDITELKRIQAEQTLALSLATNLARANSVKEAAREVCDALCHATGHRRAAIRLFDERGVSRFEGWRGLSDAYRASVEVGFHWKQFQRDVAPVVWNSIDADPSLEPFRESLRREGIGALACVPITSENGLIGMLSMYADAPGAIAQAHITIARSIAMQLASTLDRLRLTERVGRSELLVRSIIGTALDAVIAMDSNGCITAWNAQAERTFGWSAAEVTGRRLDELVIPPELREAHRSGLARFCTTGETRILGKRIEVPAIRRDGQRITVELAITPIRTDDGVVFSAFLRDITQAKKAAADLVQARAAAEAASRAKSEFLANMSHEIRTPLTAIMGYADLLRDDTSIAENADRRRRTIDTIRSAGQHLMSIINDILDLSKIEASRMTVERVETPLAHVLMEVESLMRPRADAKGVLLKVCLDTPIPDRILSDPTRVRQILVNLVGNAAKFTEAGSIVVRARVCRNYDAQELVIDVEDTGIGMQADSAARLFEAFAQGDTTVTRRHGGTGLGLIISRRLAELLGGTVSLDWTQPGRGSRFRLALPLFAPSNASLIDSLDAVQTRPVASRPVAEARLAGRVLLAEDGIDNQRLIAHHLRKAGAEVDVAENGRVALELIRRAENNGTPYSLLVTDMQMPEVDGYTLARTLRDAASTLPIIALTAHAMAEDREKCLRAGCDDFITKPIDRATLVAACAAWIGRVGGASGRRAA